MCGPKPYGNFFQYFTALLGNLLTISYGFMFGLTPPTLVLYKSEHTPLTSGPLSDESLSWITTYLCIGAIVGVVFFKHLSDHFGRRATLLLAGIAQNIGWFGVAFGYNFTHICISRLVVGLSGGAALVILPIFLTEISKSKNPENPHLITYAFQAFGIMLGFLFGTFVDSIVAATAGLIISVLFSLSFPFVQESPYHYLKKNDMQMLEKSLRYFRAIRDLDQREIPEFLAEVQKFKQQGKSSNGTNGTATCKQSPVSVQSTTDSRSCCELLQAFLSCMILIITSQLCGLFTMLNYSSLIFESLGLVLPVHLSSLALGISMFVGSIVAVFMVSCTWKKFITSMFSLLIGLCLAILGFIVWKSDISEDTGIDWIPVLCLNLIVLLASASIYPMAFIILADLFPNKNSSILRTFFYALHWVLGLLLIKFHFCIVELIGIHIYFWVFSGACVFQCILIIFLMPSKQQKTCDR